LILLGFCCNAAKMSDIKVIKRQFDSIDWI
jgi:hypothetical protein